MNQYSFWIAALGVLTTVGGWLAGRSKRWEHAYVDMCKRYEGLVALLSAEIDRLSVKIHNLEDTIRELRAKVSAT